MIRVKSGSLSHSGREFKRALRYRNAGNADKSSEGVVVTLLDRLVGVEELNAPMKDAL
jgi:hypothetical protein